MAGQVDGNGFSARYGPIRRWLSALALVALTVAVFAGCASTAITLIKELRFDPLTHQIIASPDSYVLDVKPQRQRQSNLCGAAALAMVLTYWGTDTNVFDIVAELGPPGKNGYSGAQLKALAKKYKYAAFVYRGSILDLFINLSKNRPLIIIKSIATINHFVVVMGVTRDGQLIVADPARGAHIVPASDIATQWKRAKFFSLLIAPAFLKPKPPPKNMVGRVKNDPSRSKDKRPGAVAGAEVKTK